MQSDELPIVAVQLRRVACRMDSAKTVPRVPRSAAPRPRCEDERVTTHDRDVHSPAATVRAKLSDSGGSIGTVAVLAVVFAGMRSPFVPSWP